MGRFSRRARRALARKAEKKAARKAAQGAQDIPEQTARRRNYRSFVKELIALAVTSQADAESVEYRP